MTSFKTRNEPKMKLFEFGAFQKIRHMASREKHIFHKLFGAFHDTPRITKIQKFLKSSSKMPYSNLFFLKFEFSRLKNLDHFEIVRK